MMADVAMNDAVQAASGDVGAFAAFGGRRPRVALLSTQLDMAYLLPAFAELFPEADVRLQAALGDLQEIDAAVCWMPPRGLLARMPELKLIQSIAAGIDHITADPGLPAVPVCRMVDPDMAAGMAAYVCWAVTNRQRHMYGYVASAAERQWREQPVEAPGAHRVGIAGLGALGVRCALALRAIGYRVSGWSRGPKSGLPADIALFHGDAQRAAFLAGCDTLVCLLPYTPETHGILDAGCYDRLPRGAHLVNVGRGAHVVEADLLRALDSGQLGYATLDTFTEEPLPADHPYWTHPRILVTPHIASRTPARAIARQTRANLAQIILGNAAAVAVDPAKGY
ncbi:glyoxylate/hydroxypyruvate reductase A [Bordetella bronchialis]